MAFDGTEGEFYTPEKAGEFTRRYRNARINPVEGCFIGREKLQAILNQPNCVGVRVYFGMDSDNTMNMVFVGADNNQNDILDVVVENVRKNPPYGSDNNPLNS